jgi:Zn-dependent M28 family amino/carboxypeptidase
MMLTLANLLQQKAYQSSNYLFIAFSAEELGLLGSKYFVEHPTIDLKSVRYMINLDMVGRLNDSTQALTVGGFGTSPIWSKIIATKENGLLIKIDSSGAGPSDHTSFYRKNIPVLFFFTGVHGDYHKPSDDVEKINLRGMVTITRLIQTLVLKSLYQRKRTGQNQL